jgi:anti-sigma B factor antagonist
MDDGAPPRTYEVDFDLGPSYVRVRLWGEIDLTVYRDLADELAGAALLGRPLLVVDLDRVTFLSIVGARLLLTVDSHMTARGGRLAIVCREPRLQRLLRMAELDRRLTLVPSLRAALGEGSTPPAPATVARRHWMVRHGLGPAQQSA